MDNSRNYSNPNMISLENIIYGSFVKMDRLQQLTINTFSNTSIAAATKLNIFIDLYSVLKSVFSEKYRTDITDYTAITSGIINMCSHYRSFFRRLQVETKFYLIFSFNTCEINRKFFAGYNKTFMKKSEIPLFNKLAMDNFDLLDSICPYLPDIFFIKSARNYESAVIIAHIINMLNDGLPNLIISRDLYPLQLCTYFPYTSYLYPLKFHGNDYSIMIPISEKPSFRIEFWNLVAHVRNIKVESFQNISPINFTLLSALNRFPERDIPLMTNFTSAISIIKKFVGDTDFKVIIDQLFNDAEVSSKLPVVNIESRLKALDIMYMLSYYQNDPESLTIQFLNIQDNSAINMINSKYFSHNPLDLGRL